MSFLKALHLKIIDFNPLPQQSALDAYCKVYQNGYPLEELPNCELNEFLIEFKTPEDIVKLEVWANNEEENVVFIGAVSIDMSFWEQLRPLLIQQQIIYLEPVENLILSKEDYGYQCIDEANLKIEFRGFDTTDKAFLYQMLTTQSDSSTYKIFGDYLEYEKSLMKQSPTRSPLNTTQTSKRSKRVKFLDFVANNTIKPERKLENSIMLNSKDIIQNYSPDAENDKIIRSDNKAVSHNNKVESNQTQDFEISINEEDPLLYDSNNNDQQKSSIQGIIGTRQLENEEEVQSNLDIIKREYEQSVENYQNEADEILK